MEIVLYTKMEEQRNSNKQTISGMKVILKIEEKHNKYIR